MAKECGFFNARQIVNSVTGDVDYDRVYLAEQFAAYFASFIGNGVFGHSMQKLQVLCQASPDMSVKVLPGEAWINGWWYRDKEEFILPLDVADGVLSRIDVIVLRWGNQERDMWLQVIKGTASGNPSAPLIRRDADYYDLQLATVSIAKGTVRITQSAITDTRLDNSVCGLVTGVVDQIDTTGLYNQFTAYFDEFKANQEADFNQWAADQMQQYIDYIAGQQNALADWITGTQKEYEDWTADKVIEYNRFVAGMQDSYSDWLKFRDDYEAEMVDTGKGWSDRWEQWFLAYVNDNTKDIADWKKKNDVEFNEWWDALKGILDNECCSSLAQAVVALGQQLKDLNQFREDFEYRNTIWSPWYDRGFNLQEPILDTNLDEILDTDGNAIVVMMPSDDDMVLDSNGSPIEFRKIFTFN